MRQAFSSNIFFRSRTVAPLKLGRHKYFGREIDVQAIPTVRFGLCYKLELISKDAIPIDGGSNKTFMLQFHIIITSSLPYY